MNAKDIFELLEPYFLKTKTAKEVHGHQIWLDEMNAGTRNTDKSAKQPLLSPLLRNITLEILHRTRPYHSAVKSLKEMPRPGLEFEIPLPKSNKDMKLVCTAFHDGKLVSVSKPPLILVHSLINTSFKAPVIRFGLG